jgi:gluconolactonase
MLEEPRNELIDQAEAMSSELREHNVDRRRFLAGLGAGAAVAVGAGAALAQDMGPMAPPSTVTSPPRDFGPGGAPTTYFWDPDVIAVDPSFNGLAQPNSAIQRLWTGALWAEGPAWNAQGRYLVWSDIPNNRQMRWIEDDGHVSVFRMPSNNSNGNTFDFQGRQISCEHLMRRVVRYELDGSVSVIADSFEGKRLNSPNDAVPHPDGRRRRADQPRRPAEPPPGPACRHRHRVAASASDPDLPFGPEWHAHGGRHRGAGPGPQRPLLLA